MEGSVLARIAAALYRADPMPDRIMRIRYLWDRVRHRLGRG